MRDDPHARFAVPTSALKAALCVPAPVRTLLRIDAYSVDDDGSVQLVEE